MAWYENIPKAFATIVPNVDADPAHQLQWRWSVAVFIMALFLSQVGHILIACGWMTTFGLPGFANASDLANLQVAQTRMEVRQIERALPDLESSYCKAVEAGKPTMFITDQIRSNMRDYQVVYGSSWGRPSCAELGE